MGGNGDGGFMLGLTGSSYSHRGFRLMPILSQQGNPDFKIKFIVHLFADIMLILITDLKNSRTSPIRYQPGPSYTQI